MGGSSRTSGREWNWTRVLTCAGLLVWLALVMAPLAHAQTTQGLPAEPAQVESEGFKYEHLRQALMRLPLAAALGAALAIRPRRRGTPARSPAVIQTQIILAI